MASTVDRARSRLRTALCDRLGLEAPAAELDVAFRAAAGQAAIKGFAIGRTIFNEAARDWLAGRIGDAAATADMAERFGNLVGLWQKAQS